MNGLMLFLGLTILTAVILSVSGCANIRPSEGKYTRQNRIRRFEEVRERAHREPHDPYLAFDYPVSDLANPNWEVRFYPTGEQCGTVDCEEAGVYGIMKGYQNTAKSWADGVDDFMKELADRLDPENAAQKAEMMYWHAQKRLLYGKE